MKKNIIFLGVTDNYPLMFSANNSKNELIAKALMKEGYSVTIVNSILGFKGLNNKYRYSTEGEINAYIFPEKGLIQIWKNLLDLYRILNENYNNNQSNYIFIGYTYFPLFLLNVLYAKILNYKTIVLITEWHLFFENIKLLRKIDYFLFDKFFGYFVDGILPISKYILNKVVHFRKPILIIPILADFSQSRMNINLDVSSTNRYFLYCGNVVYFPVIDFIIRSYKLFSDEGGDTKLYLILSGPQEGFIKVNQLIKDLNLFAYINIVSNLSHCELTFYYENALALLIPLRQKKQDTARFPHKIGEYLASGRPIITGNVGEVGRHFEHEVNAFLAAEYTPEAYSAIMECIERNISIANKVGENGRKLGLTKFNFEDYGELISNFLERV